MFERIADEMEKLYNKEIDTLDILAIDADLKEFFEKTELNIYAGDRRKINKALKESGLEIVKIRHKKQGPWNPITTYVTFYVDTDSSPYRKQRIFGYCWR